MSTKWKRFSGIWTQTQQSQAVGSNTWPGIVLNELYVWGSNSQGNLGINAYPVPSAVSSPTQVGTDTHWSGPFFTTRVGNSWFGSTIGMFSVGSDYQGALALNTNSVYRSSPVQVDSNADWTKIVSGEVSMMGIRGGKLYGWGQNGSGQLAVGDTQRRSSPTQVGALTTWTDCAQSDNCGAAIGAGKLYTFGTNDGYGLLGRDTNTGGNSSPIQVGALTNWSKVSGGKQFFLAIRTDGTMWSWGINNGGQIGNNTYNINYSSPVQIGALTTWSEVAAGYDQGIALKTDGTIWGWGKNGSGQVGDNSGIDRSSPVQIGALTTWTKIGAGQNRSAGQVTGGSLYVWGNCSNGIVGDDLATTGFQVSPVLVAGGAWGEWAFYNCFVAAKTETIS